MGNFFNYFLHFRKSVIRKNLILAFPGLKQVEYNKLIKSCYRHYGLVLIDFLRMPSLNIHNINDIIHIDDKSLNILKKNNGGILLTAHIGNWEYILPGLGLKNFKIAAVTKNQKNKQSNVFFTRIRKSVNAKIISHRAGSKPMINIMHEGYYLGLASDQNAGKKGVQSIFFNRSVSVPKGAAIFYLKTKYPIIIGFCILKNDFTYKISFKKLNLDGLPSDSADAIKDINQRYTNELEKIVTKYPHQYFWFHKKWPKKLYNEPN